MYNPQRFKSEDLDAAFDLMDRYPFANVITVADGMPVVSQLPLTPLKSGGGIELVGHLARANPQWRSFAACKATLVFQGPHTFITPSWYVEDDVPTWNYTTVHATGAIRLVEDYEGLVECLRILTSHVERHWPSGWKFSIPQDLAGDVLVKSIVGFRIRVEEFSFKKKLSQNRSPEDRAGILKGLSARNDAGSRAVRGEMQKLFGPDGKLNST